ncbi:uncharacterized protein LOC110811184 isoform X2 [Carica papaya]|nr:uncharacterized protein LOC110811184 isoform X2 [Carica papaya]XP_021893292.1 uncharacterized protein LOC110811184 isoform X2 [Carica papaya]
MKLQFVLSEEERNRIRIMRETALKKKHQKLVNNSHRNPENATSVDSQRSQNKMVNEETGSASIPVSFFKNIKFDMEEKEGEPPTLKQMIPNDTDRKERNPLDVTKSGLAEKISQLASPVVSGTSSMSKLSSLSRQLEPTLLLKDKAAPSKQAAEEANKLKQQNPLEKTPTNVRKVINALETSLTQDIKPNSKSSWMKPQPSSIGMDSSFKSSLINEMKKGKDKSVAGKTIKLSLTEELRQTPTEKRKQIGLNKPSHTSASSHNSSNVKELSPEKTENSKTDADLKNKFKVLQKEVDVKQVHIRGASSNKLKHRACQDGKYYTSESSGLWVFPDEGKPLCITAGGKRVMDLMGSWWIQSNINQQETSAPETIGENHVCRDTVNDGGKPSRNAESLADVESTRGAIGQVIRAAITVGFAALVLLTREQKNR